MTDGVLPHSPATARYPGWDRYADVSLRGRCAVGLVRGALSTVRALGRAFAFDGATSAATVRPERGRRIARTVEGAVAALVAPAARSRTSERVESHAPVPIVRFRPRGRQPGGPVLLYLHGGSYALERGPLHDVLAGQLAEACDADVYALDYRLAPEHPFPAALEDAVAGCRWLQQARADRDLVLVGDSAGAGLALALLQVLRGHGLPLPRCAALLCPWADLTFSGATLVSNAGRDPYMTDLDAITLFAEMYLDGQSPKHPLVSPVFADFAGFPPTLIHAGSTDMLRSDAERVAAGLRQAGCTVRLEVWDQMPHVWQRLGAAIPEARASLERIGAFVAAQISRDRAA